MARRLFWHIFPGFSILSLLSILVIVVVSTAFYRSFLYDTITDELTNSSIILAGFISEEVFSDPEAAVAFCRRSAAGTNLRITVIIEDGTVIGDSHQDRQLMDNHSTRPEIRDAFRTGAGSAGRRSSTMGYHMVYHAVSVDLPNQTTGILRVARAVDEIEALLDEVFGRIALTTVILIVGVSLASLTFARFISAPLSALRRSAVAIAEGSNEPTPRFDSPEEVRSLSEAFAQMYEQLGIRFRTITTQRNELQAILSAMLEAVVVLNHDITIRELNAAAERLFGIESDKAAGKNLLEVYRNSALYDLACRVLEEGGPIESTISIYNPFTSIRAWSFNNKSRQEEPQSFLQAHGILLEYTESDIQREGVLLVLNDITRLIKLENIRKDFVANVSHELKTPITSIKGFVETLLEGALDDADNASRFLEIINKHTDRLMNIIEDLLSLSRLERDDRDSEFRPSNVKAVIGEAVQVCSEKAADREITIEVECPPHLAAEMNPLLIEQAVVNLVDNGVKYSDIGSTVTVKCREEDGTVRITVADSGCGIPLKDIPRIFERFYRVDKARSRDLGGTGLGLAIVKHIILEHDGTIEVDSTEGEGSTFTLIFPSRR
jgi:two-component system, OmpR family, phosphate regulon sensor histidine kinase PhoR